MLALIVTIEQGVFRGNLSFCNTTGLCWNLTGRHLERTAAGCDILCVGDSMLRFGLIPRVIRERTGRPTASLAAVGGSPASSYFLLRRALDAGAFPSILLVDASKNLLRYEPASTENVFPWAELLGLRESLELCWAARDPDLFARIILDRLLPSVRNRFEVRDYVRKALREEERQQRLAGLAILRNWNRNDGTMVLGKIPFQDQPAPPEKDRMTNTWKPDPANVYFLRKLFSLAEERRIRVAWLLLPLSPGSQAADEFVGSESRYESFVRSEQARHPDLVVLDARHPGYEASFFHDAGHLNRDGAQALSAAVADVLRGGGLDSASPERWVALPASRTPANEIPMEDLDQSWLALRNILQGQGRR
jgi:hypothetical protein